MGCACAILAHSKQRREQIEYLVNNFKEPVFRTGADGNNNSLVNAFNMQGNADGWNPAGITFRLINYTIANNNHSGFPDIGRFMAGIQDYMPYSLRVNPKNKLPIWRVKCYNKGDDYIAQLPPETQEAIELFNDWYIRMRNMIEDKLAEFYYWSGKPQNLEILKRRYKADYSEKIEQSVDANVDATTDNKLEIVIKECSAK